MKRKTKMLIGTAVLVALLGAGTAEGLTIRAGDLLVIGNGGFRPTKLPKHHDAPITIYGGGRIDTVSGNLPPIIETITFEFDRHGSVDTKGLPVCTPGRLEATTVAGARHLCPGSIVGKGEGSALVTFPEQAPFKVSSPITVFNGPRKDGNPTVLAHAYTTVPVPTTFIVPVEIEKISKGVYGYRTEARIPRIANGYGIPDLRQPDDRPPLDLQGRQAQLRQRPLRNRSPSGPRAVHLQERHRSAGHFLPALSGSRIEPGGGVATRRRRGAPASSCRLFAPRRG